MAIATNADEYAKPRQNMFFTGVVPSLDGQCVSLVKWFMQEMSEVPNPQAARGDARYVGQTLVRQGHATEVPYSERKRGDIICYEYGEYGHIAVQLSNGKVFEQNVNLGGVASKIVDGARVYASRIGNETEAFRKSTHVYRLKSYNEGGDSMNTPPVNAGDAYNVFRGLGYEPNENDVAAALGKDWKQWIYNDVLTHGGLFTEGKKRIAALEAENLVLKRELEQSTKKYKKVDVYIPVEE